MLGIEAQQIFKEKKKLVRDGLICIWGLVIANFMPIGIDIFIILGLIAYMFIVQGRFYKTVINAELNKCNKCNHTITRHDSKNNKCRGLSIGFKKVKCQCTEFNKKAVE